MACPDWLPRDEDIIERLGSHQTLYRFRKPRYQLQLLKDLAAILDPATAGSSTSTRIDLVAKVVASMFPGKTVTAIDMTNRVQPTVRGPQKFAGQIAPFERGSFDCALFATSFTTCAWINARHCCRGLRVKPIRPALPLGPYSPAPIWIT